ncbi:MAG TPA: hypothetical protein VIV27_09385 [Halioglobus sp.]
MPSEKSTFYSRDPSSVSGDKPGTLKVEEASPSKKASFYAKDPAPPSSNKANPTKKKYMGEERRKGNRRKAQDRRGDVRFDLTKTDRRQSDGRRETDATVKYW